LDKRAEVTFLAKRFGYGVLTWGPRRTHSMVKGLDQLVVYGKSSMLKTYCVAERQLSELLRSCPAQINALIYRTAQNR
jgi:hypothetical protein